MGDFFSTYGLTLGEKLDNYYVEKETGCHVWEGATNDAGYPVTKEFGKMWYMHRLVYSIFVSEIPEGMTVDHMCYNPLCINIEHLQLLTHSENASNTRNKGVRKQFCECGEQRVLRPTGRMLCMACRNTYMKEYLEKNKDRVREKRRLAAYQRSYGTDCKPVYAGANPAAASDVLPRGVQKCGDKFRARTSHNYKNIHLGVYETIEEARNAYIEYNRKNRPLLDTNYKYQYI